MLTKQCTGLHGEKRDYYLYPKAIPPFEMSDFIQNVLFDTYRYHSGEGDMWAHHVGIRRRSLLWGRR